MPQTSTHSQPSCRDNAENGQNSEFDICHTKLCCFTKKVEGLSPGEEIRTGYWTPRRVFSDHQEKLLADYLKTAARESLMNTNLKAKTFGTWMKTGISTVQECQEWWQTGEVSNVRRDRGDPCDPCMHWKSFGEHDSSYVHGCTSRTASYMMAHRVASNILSTSSVILNSTQEHQLTLKSCSVKFWTITTPTSLSEVYILPEPVAL